jgi:isopenicillin N synthase-like dioxygenase
MKLANWIRKGCACAVGSAMTIGAVAAHANEATFDATIPVLDMNEYFDPETKDKFVKELYNAMREVGFFAVVNTGVDLKILNDGYQACSEYFAFPFETKIKCAPPECFGQRGYVYTERAKGSPYIDFKEFYHVGRERTGLRARKAEEALAEKLMPNVWPEGMNLKTPLNRLFSALEECMVPLQRAFAEALGLPANYFDVMTEYGEHLLRASHYPANPPADRLWAAEHTDIDLFTILPISTADGLQLLNTEGNWLDIRVPENAFIINGGDMLQNLTNGEFKSGLHRVIANADGYERFSVVFFIHPPPRIGSIRCHPPLRGREGSASTLIAIVSSSSLRESSKWV